MNNKIFTTKQSQKAAMALIQINDNMNIYKNKVDELSEKFSDKVYLDLIKEFREVEKEVNKTISYFKSTREK